MTRPPMLAADHIRELVKPYATHEIVTQPVNGVDTQRVHTVHHASLLNQLREATHGSSNKSDSDASRGVAMSKPAAHLEALDILARIDKQSLALAATLEAGYHRRLEDRLLAISGAIGSDINHRVRSWWAAARLATHHDTAPLRPHGVPCLTCSEFNTLRIRVEDEIATCTNCGDVWDRTGEPGHWSLDALGQHVAWCSEHEISKARHWTVGVEGFPTECTTCLAFREKFAQERKNYAEDLDKTPDVVSY